MSADKKLALMKNIFKQFAATGDVTVLLENMTEDVVYKLSVGPGTPLSGEFHRKEGVAGYFKGMPDVVKHVGLNVYDFFANDEKAVVTGDETLFIHKNGETFFTEWAVVCTFRDDKISQVLVIENLGPLVQAYAAPAMSS